MPLDPSDLSTLSRLLDQALDLAPAQAEAWLAALPAEHAHLQPRLREMLAEHLSQGHAGFMSDGPKLSDSAPLADDSVARAGDLVGPYRLLREIGHGGMGTVWLAERADGSLKRQIALKLPRLAWGAGLAERMARERDIGALLEHPHIARLYDAGVDAMGRPYLALEYIDGQPLDAWCEANALGVPERLRLFLQVARAVAYAHGRLVVHRDLKPSNVLVTPDGQAHLLDFGIAKLLHEAAPGEARLTQEQGRVLTPHYASPEQIRGEAITVQSDVYSLGVLLYELLTGQPPYAPERKSLAAIEEAILRDEPAPASSKVGNKATAKALRGEIDAILAKALRREPSQRYTTADAMAEDIERHLTGETVLAQPDSVGYRLTKAIKRHRAGFAAGSAILLAVLIGAGVSLVQAKRANAEAERARVVREFVVDVFKVNERGNPANNELRQLPVELLLERGAKLIDTKFAGQPQLQAELFGVVGGIFADMGANELAADYATKQIEALVAIASSPSDQARATMLLAEVLLAQDRLRDADVRARRAVVLVESDPEQRPRALVLLAQVLLRQGQLEEAVRMLDRADKDMKDKTAPTVIRARAKATRAQMLVNRFDEAFPILLSAIDDAIAAEGPLSPTAVNIRLMLVTGLVSRNRIEDARAPREAALSALRALGGANEIRAALEESRLARNLFMMGHAEFEEARATIERDRSFVIARSQLLPQTVKASIELDLGSVYLTWGDVERSDRLVSAAASHLRPAAQSPHAVWEISGFHGFTAMAAGRHEQAEALTREHLEMRKAMGQASSPFAAYDYTFVAFSLGMQKRFKEALDILASAPMFGKMIGDPTAAGDDYASLITNARARLMLDAGDPALALTLPSVAEVDAETVFAEFGDRRLTLGEAWCVSNRSAEGLALLEATVVQYASRSYAHNPHLARARAVAGLCALAAAQRSRAEELAMLAREAFVAQPGVSPYFKAPSERLDLLLRSPARQR